MKKLNRLYLGTNTKMYKTIAETTSFLTQLRQLTEDLADSPLTLFVIPSFTSLESANRITSGSHIRLGARTCAGRTRDSSPAKSRLSCLRKWG